MHQLHEEVVALAEGIELTVIRSKNGSTVKVKVGGKVNGIDIKGETLAIHLGLEDLDLGLVQGSLPKGRLQRTDGHGKSLSTAIYTKVERAILAKLKKDT